MRNRPKLTGSDADHKSKLVNDSLSTFLESLVSLLRRYSYVHDIGKSCKEQSLDLLGSTLTIACLALCKTIENDIRIRKCLKNGTLENRLPRLDDGTTSSEVISDTSNPSMVVFLK